MKTGNTGQLLPCGRPVGASMEPGHEDREYTDMTRGSAAGRIASMEPGHEDREYAQVDTGSLVAWLASMEPGHEDREYLQAKINSDLMQTPQWSPVMKTGNTCAATFSSDPASCASMEPGHEDREYVRPRANSAYLGDASMEPGHEDREYAHTPDGPGHPHHTPQWSPVMKTGNTRGRPVWADLGCHASMEPGHEDREY